MSFAHTRGWGGTVLPLFQHMTFITVVLPVLSPVPTAAPHFSVRGVFLDNVFCSGDAAGMSCVGGREGLPCADEIAAFSFTGFGS